MKLTTRITSFTIVIISLLILYPSKFVDGVRSSESKLILNKCCEVGEYLREDGTCVWINRSFRSSTNGSNIGLPILSDFDRDLTETETKVWMLPRDLFYFNDGSNDNYNIVENQIQIERFDTKRPRCIGKSKMHQGLSTGHIAPSSENVFLFLEPSDPDDKENFTQNFVVHKDNFCIDGTETGEFMVELCIQKCEVLEDNNLDEFSSSKSSATLEVPACITKCCMPHEILDLNNFACIDVQEDNFWHPVVTIPSASEVLEVSDDKEGGDGSVSVPILMDRKERQLIVSKTGLPKCQIGSYNVDFRDRMGYRSVSLLSSGILMLESIEGKRIEISRNRFCIDGLFDNKNYTAEVDTSNNYITKTNTGYDQIAIVCFDDMEVDADEKDVLEQYRPVLFPILTGISSIFLLLTSIIYLILWKDMYLPGWLQFSYTSSLLIAFSLLTIVQIWTEQLRGHQLCRIIGYTLHATFLSCFFWLTSMNIDLWCSFRNTPVMTGFGRSRGRRRYFGFALFSISIPVGVTIAAVVIDDMHRFSPGNSVIKTEIGETSCALNIQNKMAQLYYFYGVVGILFMVNLMFFFCTVLCLRERQRETKFAHRQCTASDSDMQRFRLFTRLFFIMGILWIFELISWVTSFYELDRNIQLIFLATDCLNALQGLGVFSMFVWKRHTWKQLRKKYRKVLRLDSRTSMTGPSTIKSSVKSSTTTKSGSVSSKPLSPT